MQLVNYVKQSKNIKLNFEEYTTLEYLEFLNYKLDSLKKEKLKHIEESAKLCNHKYVKSFPCGPRDNGEYYLKCSICNYAI